jgi:hypothetical protein
MRMNLSRQYDWFDFSIWNSLMNANKSNTIDIQLIIIAKIVAQSIADTPMG